MGEAVEIEALARELCFDRTGTARIYHEEVWRDLPDDDRTWEHDEQTYCEWGKTSWRKEAARILTLIDRAKSGKE